MSYEQRRDNLVLVYGMVEQCYSRGIKICQKDLLSQVCVVTGVREVTAREYVSALFTGFVGVWGPKRVLFKIKVQDGFVVVDK